MSISPTLNKRLIDIMSVVESTNNAMVMLDQAGCIVLVNKKVEKMFGYARDELLGRPIEMLVPDRFRKSHAEFRNGFFAHSTARPMGTGGVYGRRRDGTEFPAEIALNPIQTQQGLLVLSTIVGVSDGPRNDDAMPRPDEVVEEQTLAHPAYLESDIRELQEFTHMLSQDLKEPLREIEDKFAWLARDLRQHLTEEERESVNLLRGRVQRMGALLEDLLEYSRIKMAKGRRSPSHQPQSADD